MNILKKRIILLDRKIERNQSPSKKSQPRFLENQNTVFHDDSLQCSSTGAQGTAKVALERNEVDVQELGGKLICVYIWQD